MIILHILLMLKESWSYAFTLIIVGVIVVFAALALLVIILNSMPAIGNTFNRLGKPGLKKSVILKSDRKIPAQVSAAIAAAVYLYLDEVHDKESGMMTIKKVSRTYSPWSSKLCGLNIFKK
jgi:glutaconyl-CoA/methylmalonyl-CoA decarboxylase subunit delta